eukprot:SAG11_NODE_6567_length_1287_cov_1.416667_2_plen_208_part_00
MGCAAAAAGSEPVRGLSCSLQLQPDMMRLQLLQLLVSLLAVPRDDAIDLADIPTFRFTCAVTNSLDAPAPPLPPVPDPPPLPPPPSHAEEHLIHERRRGAAAAAGTRCTPACPADMTCVGGASCCTNYHNRGVLTCSNSSKDVTLLVLEAPPSAPCEWRSATAMAHKFLLSFFTCLSLFSVLPCASLSFLCLPEKLYCQTTCRKPGL